MLSSDFTSLPGLLSAGPLELTYSAPISFLSALAPDLANNLPTLEILGNSPAYTQTPIYPNLLSNLAVSTYHWGLGSTQGPPWASQTTPASLGGPLPLQSDHSCSCKTPWAALLGPSISPGGHRPAGRYT